MENILNDSLPGSVHATFGCLTSADFLEQFLTACGDQIVDISEWECESASNVNISEGQSFSVDTNKGINGPSIYFSYFLLELVNTMRRTVSFLHPVSTPMGKKVSFLIL
jgi:hypothetical protein